MTVNGRYQTSSMYFSYVYIDVCFLVSGDSMTNETVWDHVISKVNNIINWTKLELFQTGKMLDNANKPQSLSVCTFLLSIQSSISCRLSRFNLMNEAVDHFMIDFKLIE